MGDVHYIVDKLKAQPYSFDVTLLSFSEKSPQELLKLLSDVAAKISPKLQKAAANESAEQTAERLAEFLRIVKYSPNQDPAAFGQLLAAADRDVVYAVLKWLLSQGQLLEKRAFVGFYLTLPDMPEDLHYDSEVMDLKEAIKSLQADFIDTHKALDLARDGVKQLPQLRTRIKQMQEEKERLADKVERAAAQAAVLPDAGSYRDVCIALRQEHDREVLISQQLQAQQQQMERAEAAFQRGAGRLREMQQHLASHGGPGAARDGSQALELLQDDVVRLRAQVTTRLPRELEAKQRRLAAVQDTLNNGINTEGDLQQLLAQEAALKQQVAALQDRQAAAERARAADRAYLQVRQAQQMAVLVSRKKGELEAKLARLQERRDALAAALDSSSSSAAARGDGSEGAGVSDEEWRSKYESIKARLPTYKAMKRELGELEGEVFVLNRTQEILQQQETAARGRVQQLEAKAGVQWTTQLQGYADLAAGLEKVSEEKGAADEAQGAVLQEVSSTVERITAAVNQKKVQLAPAVQELRSLREAHAALEAQAAEKKAAYEAALGGLESAVSGLESEVASLQQEAQAGSLELGKVKGRVGELEGQLRRIAVTGSEDLKRRCQLQLAESEARLRHLREQQRQARDQHSHGVRQIGMMSDAMQLLQVKQQLLEVQVAAGTQQQQVHSQAQGSPAVVAMLPAAARLAGLLPQQPFNTNVMVL